jgi:hypothetical protein
VENLVEKLLRHFIPNYDRHLSDERIAALFCRDLSVHRTRLAERWTARIHLRTCASCKSRQEELLGSRAERMLVLYRESTDSADCLLPVEPRVAFSKWLELELQTHVAELARPRQRLLRMSALRRHPGVFATAIAGILVSAVIGTWIAPARWWKRTPEITANALLVHAESWDHSGAKNRAGVAQQTVLIQSAGRTLKRSVYWDMQGVRQPRPTALEDADARLKSKLNGAGVDWNRPISATDYQSWHDNQHIRADRIIRSGAHLLTLTTTVPDGDVMEQSLTVRDTDFHPVRRMVDFRDKETVEIAELDFAIVPWSVVSAEIFEPAAGSPGALASDLPRALLPRATAPPTPEQLDETELAARLILNQLQADTGEQVEIRRLPQEVAVEGIVDTDQRKYKLTAQLAMVPRLHIAIKSVADIGQQQDAGGVSFSVRTASMPDQPSALETLLRARRRDVNDINDLARKIFENAMTISQESRSIVDLRSRFAARAAIPLVTEATLEELVYSHHEHLQEALKRQRVLLAEAGGKTEAAQYAAATLHLSLTDAAAKNLELSRELTQTNAPAVRSAESLFGEMSALSARIAASAHEAFEKSNNDSTPKR